MRAVLRLTQRGGSSALVAAMLAIALIASACSAPVAKSAATAAATAVASTGGPASAGPIAVSLKEWTIEVSAPTAKAGAVIFNTRNDGKVPHDLVIVRSDAAPNALPTTSGLVDETKVTIVGRTEQLTPGDGKRLAVDLPAGKYVLVCNVIGHYNSGQFAAFTVQ